MWMRKISFIKNEILVHEMEKPQTKIQWNDILVEQNQFFLLYFDSQISKYNIW